MTEANKNFLMNMWLMCRVTEVQIQSAYVNGKITEAERDEILAAPRNCG